MNRQPGDTVYRTKRGVEVVYSPSMGSSTRYRVICPHGESVNARTQTDAREDAALVNEWCMECARYLPPSTPQERSDRLKLPADPGYYIPCGQTDPA